MLVDEEGSYRKRNEIVRLENEIVITEIVFENSLWMTITKDSKFPPYTNSHYSSL
jgi:hypothetical protein